MFKLASFPFHFFLSLDINVALTIYFCHFAISSFDWEIFIWLNSNNWIVYLFFDHGVGGVRRREKGDWFRDRLGIENGLREQNIILFNTNIALGLDFVVQWRAIKDNALVGFKYFVRRWRIHFLIYGNRIALFVN